VLTLTLTPGLTKSKYLVSRNRKYTSRRMRRRSSTGCFLVGHAKVPAGRVDKTGWARKDRNMTMTPDQCRTKPLSKQARWTWEGMVLKSQLSPKSYRQRRCCPSPHRDDDMGYCNLQSPSVALCAASGTRVPGAGPGAAGACLGEAHDGWIGVEDWGLGIGTGGQALH